MTTSPQPTFASGSSSTSYVSGTFSFLDPLEDYLDNAIESVAEAIEDALFLARSEIREAALRDPDWKRFADILDVEYDDGEFHYVLDTDDEDLRAAALDLEYGTEGSSPNSLIRKLARSQTASMAKQITHDLSAEVPIG